MAERISSSISRVKIKKTSVKVPKLKVKKEKSIKPKKEDSFPISSIVNILIKSAIDKTKKERKEKVAVDEDKSYILKKGERELVVNGGYGTVSKGYGNAPNSSYVDYGKLFSYLGKFRAKGAYQSLNGSNLQNNGNNGFALASSETMDKATRHIKYLRPSGREFGVGAGGIDSISLVPMGGMDAAEWEEFKLWFQLDKVAYYLKRKMA